MRKVLLTILLFIVFCSADSWPALSCGIKNPFHKRMSLGSDVTTNINETFEVDNQAVLDLVNKARLLGPVANDRTDFEKEQILQQARTLANNATITSSSSAPTHVDLTGVHERLYSTSPGKRRGRIRQRFLNATFLENSVQFGPVSMVATATLTPTSLDTSTIEFHSLSYRILGLDVPWGRKSLQGSEGTWKFLFVGNFVDPLDGKLKRLRVMETPSLFMLLQEL